MRAEGRGVVFFLPATALTGRVINLRSNVTLHIEAGATLLASPDAEDYPMVPNPCEPETAGFPLWFTAKGSKT